MSAIYQLITALKGVLYPTTLPLDVQLLTFSLREELDIFFTEGNKDVRDVSHFLCRYFCTLAVLHEMDENEKFFFTTISSVDKVVEKVLPMLKTEVTFRVKKGY